MLTPSSNAPRRSTTAARLLAALLPLLAGMPVAAQEPTPAAPPKPPLAIESISVTPETIVADTLCKLKVRVRNGGDATASALRFTVAINGESLTVYDRQLFMERLDPGKALDIELYNFWSTETGRPAPSDGTLRLDVTVAEARWVTIATAEDGAEEWTLGDAVPGLPVAKSAALPFGKPAPATQEKDGTGR